MKLSYVITIILLTLLIIGIGCVPQTTPAASAVPDTQFGQTHALSTSENKPIAGMSIEFPALSVETIPSLSTMMESNELLKYRDKTVEITGVITHIEYTWPRSNPSDRWACLFYNTSSNEGLSPGYTANQSPWDYVPYFRAIIKQQYMYQFSQYSSWETITRSRWVPYKGWSSAGWTSGYNEYYTEKVETKLGKLIGQKITVSGKMDIKDSAPAIYLTTAYQIVTQGN